MLKTTEKWKRIIIVRYVIQVCKRIAASVAGIGKAKEGKSGGKIVLESEAKSERFISSKNWLLRLRVLQIIVILTFINLIFLLVLELRE